MEQNIRPPERCCFTGHRPEKLELDISIIQSALEAEIDLAISEGITEFITGMARGTDILAAEIVLSRQKDHPHVKLFCAIPYAGFEEKWSDPWHSRYQSIFARANGSKIFKPNFSYGAFQERNRWMVDHSTRIIAVFNGRKGGTKNTIEYARKAGIRIRVIPG